MIELLAIFALCLALAALFNSQMDRISDESNYLHSIPYMLDWQVDFWLKTQSWRNKYKNKDIKQGPAFFGSTTFLVWLTDGWHLLKFLFNRAWQFPLAYLYWLHYSWGWAYALDLGLFYIIVGVFFGSMFSIFYRM